MRSGILTAMTLTKAIIQFADIFGRASNEDLGKQWTWQSYDSEGVRFAALRIREELQAAIAQAAVQQTQAHHILTQHHIAFRELDAVLFGLDDEAANQPPAPDEWSVYEAFRHIARAEAFFYGIITFALQNHRAVENWTPTEISEADWDEVLMSEVSFNALYNAPYEQLRQTYAERHAQIQSEFASITDAELALTARFWEAEANTIRFRLHRFESHLRQHMIQIEKALVEIGRPPTEAQRLLRLVYAAWGELEGVVVSAETTTTLTQTINQIVEEIRPILQS